MKVEIIETSRELTKKSEQIKARMVDGMVKLNDVAGFYDEGVEIEVSFIAKIEVTADDGQVNTKWVTSDVNGKTYVTGSDTYGENAMMIAREMAECPDEKVVIRAFKKVSRNDSSKKYLTCCLV